MCASVRTTFWKCYSVVVPIPCPPLASSERCWPRPSYSQSTDRRSWSTTRGTMLILIVEDEPIVAWSLAQALRDAGHTILGPTASSDEALECLHATRRGWLSSISHSMVR